MVALIVGALGAFLSVKGYVQRASRQADLLPSRTLGAHDLGINVGRVDFNAGIPEISWQPLLTKPEPRLGRCKPFAPALPHNHCRSGDACLRTELKHVRKGGLEIGQIR